ncbi:MAG: hypothetical protein ACRCXL_09025 [Dermatophilaceae bacterium]
MSIETADLYRTRDVEGTVERVAAASIAAPIAGDFDPADGIKVGVAVEKGTRLGVVLVTCETAAPPVEIESDRGADSLSACTEKRHTVRANVTGTVEQVSNGAVELAATVVTVRPPGYVIRAEVSDPKTVYDLRRPPSTAKARIVGGPAGFTVRFLARRYDSDSGKVELILAVPTSVDVVEGVRAQAAFVIARRSAVPTLPVTAVQGSDGTGQVVVVDGDDRRVAAVTLGQYDTGRVEVTGLPPGARVLRFPLAADFAAGP